MVKTRFWDEKFFKRSSYASQNNLHLILKLFDFYHILPKSIFVDQQYKFANFAYDGVFLGSVVTGWEFAEFSYKAFFKNIEIREDSIG